MYRTCLNALLFVLVGCLNVSVEAATQVPLKDSKEPIKNTQPISITPGDPLAPTFKKIIETVTVTFEQIKKEYEAHDYQKVVQLTELYLKKYPKDSDAWLFRGYAHFILKNYSEAINAFKQAIHYTKNYEDAWVGLANVFYAQKNYDEALKTVNEGLHILPQGKQLLAEKSKIVEQQKTIFAEKEKPIAPAAPEKPVMPYSYTSILAEMKANSLVSAEAHAKQYLAEYPQDLDVVFLLGQIYQRNSQWDLAKKQFEEVFNNKPTYPNALNAIMNMQFQLKGYYSVIQWGREHPGGPDASANQLLVAGAQDMLRDYPAALATLKNMPDFKTNKKAISLYENINHDTNYRYVNYFQTGMSTSFIPVIRPNQNWTLSNAYAQYHTPRGTIGAGVNYQTRPGLKAPQYLIYGDPQLAKTNYAHVAYAHSNNPTLFPNQLISLEDFQSLPYGFQISGGDTYRKLPLNYFNTYTASLGKNYKSYYFEFRPYFFLPSSGPTSLLYTFTAKKYFDIRTYIGFMLGLGTSPDLADLNTKSLIRTKVQTYMLIGQYQVTKRFDIQYGVGEQTQKFITSNSVRYYRYINLGIDYRDV